MSITTAGPSAQRPPETYAFPGVQKLKTGVGKDGIGVAKELGEVYKDLRHAGAMFACKRLVDVDPEVEALRFDAIREIVAPHQVLDELDQVRGGFSRVLSATRNVFALLPLLLTWGALGLASLAYHQELAAHPELIGTPFLDLWQTGFGGRLGLTFAGTAVIDLILLTTLVILTAVLHVAEGGEQRTASRIVGRLNAALTGLAITMQRYEKKVKKADLESVAEDIGTALGRVEASMSAIVKANEDVVQGVRDSMDSARGEVETFIEGLFRDVTATLDTLKAGYQTFIATQTSEAAGTFTEAREQTRRLFVDQVGPTIESFSSSADEYRRSAGTLSSAAGILGDSAKVLGATAGQIDGHLVKLNTNIETVGLEAGGMRDAANGVIDNNEQMKTMAEQVNVASQWVAYVTPQFAQVVKDLAETTAILRGIAPYYAPAPGQTGPRSQPWWYPFGRRRTNA